MLHDLLNTLDYKLTELKLKELHEYLNPVYPTAACWPVTNDTTAGSQVSTNAEQKISLSSQIRKKCYNSHLMIIGIVAPVYHQYSYQLQSNILLKPDASHIRL